MTVSILFRTPSADGFAISGFTDKEGNLACDVIATYSAEESTKRVKGSKTKGSYVYYCTSGLFKGTKKITIDCHHAGYGAPTAVLAALGLSDTAPKSASVEDVIASMSDEQKAALVQRLLGNAGEVKPKRTVRGKRA